MKFKIILTIFIPLMITLSMVIFLPSSLLIFANPKQENLYVATQIQNHDIYFRNVVYQDQKIIQNLLQTIEDLKMTLFGIFTAESPYQSYNTSSYNLYQPGDQIIKRDQSMYWYPGIEDNIPMTPSQQQIYNNYLGVQLYTRSSVPFSEVILSIVWTFQDNMQFTFPTVNTTQPSQMYNNNYNTTLGNYEQYNSNISVFVQGPVIVICTVMVQGGGSIGTICVDLSGPGLFNSQSVITINEMTHLILATSILTSDEIPTTVFVSNKNLGITFPATPTPITLIDPNIELYTDEFQPYWYPDSSYYFYVRAFKQEIWYQFPIKLCGTNGTAQNVFFLFAESVVNSNEYSLGVGTAYLIETTLIPFGLFSFSVLVSYFILNKIINSLVSEIDLLVKKSQSILDNDLEVNIPEYKETQEIRKLYSEFQKLAQITKFSQKVYFSGSNSEKTLKYYKALQLYKYLDNYTVAGNIYENLGNLANEEEELDKASVFYKASLESIQDIIAKQLREQTDLNTCKEIYEYLLKNGKKIPRHLKPLEVTLIRRYNEYIETSFRIASKGNFEDQEAVVSLLAGLEELRTVLKQTKHNSAEVTILLMQAEIFLSPNRRSHDVARLKLEDAEKLYFNYNKYYQDQTCQVPPEILYQHLSYLWGVFSYQEANNPLEALQYYVAAFDGDTYDPIIRKKILDNLHALLLNQGLFTQSVKESVYYQPKTNESKEYMMVLDFSKSMMTSIKIQGKIRTRLDMAIEQILRIYDQHIKANDRVSLTRFSEDTEVIFNLTQKGKYQRILRNSILKTLDQPLGAHTALYDTVHKVLISVKFLKKPKVLILIIDGGDNCSSTTLKKIQEVLRSISMLTLLIIAIDLRREEMDAVCEMREMFQTCYIVSLFDKDDVNRILKGKSYKRHYPESYIL